MVSFVSKTMYFLLALVALPRVLAADISNEALTAHNDFRAQHGASPLTWNEDLAAAANSWASRCVMEHSKGQVGDFGGNVLHRFALGYTKCSRSIPQRPCLLELVVVSPSPLRSTCGQMNIGVINLKTPKTPGPWTSPRLFGRVARSLDALSSNVLLAQSSRRFMECVPSYLL